MGGRRQHQALAGGTLGGSFLLAGVVRYFSARYVGGLDTSDLLRDGIPGTATVLSTQDTGVAINNLNIVVRLTLQVTVPGRAPYEVTIRHVLGGRNAWGSIQPGMVLPVRVDPVVHVVFTLVGPGGEQRRKEALIRVPDGKQGVLAPGRAVGVSYLAQTPDTATIDWSRT